MKEVNFTDRVPTHPGRITLTPVAGETNTYVMLRADAPTEPGTPLDKATFNSIIHSRLTGRFYDLTAKQITTTAQTGVTTNPIPTSSWVMNGETEMKSGAYTVKASSIYAANSYPLTGAVDSSTSSRWQSAGELNPWLMVALPDLLTVKKIKMRVDSHSTSYPPVTKLQGSTDSVAWTDLLTVNGRQTALTEYTLSKTGAYIYYRLLFSFPGLENDGGGQANIYGFQISEYDVYRYRNDFELQSVPTVWDVGQRLTIQTPSAFSTVGVTANRLNAVTINTILQPSKKYELRYNGTSFDAKGV